jgi:hypothetical protein
MKAVSCPSPRPTQLCSRVLSPSCGARSARSASLVTFALNESLAKDGAQTPIPSWYTPAAKRRRKCTPHSAGRGYSTKQGLDL